MPKKFKEHKSLDLRKITTEIYKYWEKKNIYNEVQKKFEEFLLKKKYKTDSSFLFVLYEGPPSLNGSPGIHHILARTIKDIFCRYNTLKGMKVFRKSGWDTHGLPIELNVEKKIGITKNDIGKKISVEKYNNICKDLVKSSMKEWILFTKKMGYWIDEKKFFITYSTKYIESVWWLIKNLYNKNLIYKGYTIQPYSPAAGTGLSYHELNIPGAYKKVEQLSPFVKFKSIKNTLPKKFQNILGNIYFIVWTTTPWTLPSNTALAIENDANYVLIRIYNYTFSKEENFIISENSINNIFSIDKYYKVVKSSDINLENKINNKHPYLLIFKFKGKDILNSKYEQLLSWYKPIPNNNNSFTIFSGDFVNSKDGTGIVHISPTFGVEDFMLSNKYNIPSILINKKNILCPLVDFHGKFDDSLPYNFGGKYIKKEFDTKKKQNDFLVDKEIILLLENINRIFKTEKYKHFYPHCWRTEKPIIYYPLNSWFMKTEKIKNKMILLNNKIKWHTYSTSENNRFNSWINNIKDWNLSRSRFWGTPLPIWRTLKGDEEIVIGSLKELFIEIKQSIKYGFMKNNNLFKDFSLEDMSDYNYKKIDLHMHNLDKIILVSPIGGKPMFRESDVIDVWFDSGSMPYAQFHYPFENKNYIDKNILFPSDFISEGIDQTRGWFFTLHAISCSLFNSISYKNVIPTGLILDINGHKMSKSKGNSINPFDLINNYGPDAIRWYIILNSNPYDNLKFDINGIKIVTKKFFRTLYNIYSFFVLYANIDGFLYKEKDNINNYTNLDFWIISELNILIKKSDKYYYNYNPTKVARLVNVFVLNKLSNWYVRLCRRRFWKTEYTKNKIAAYQVLYTCLISIIKIISPIIPFLSEKFFLDLNNITNKEHCKSVHLSSYPKYKKCFINKKLQYIMSFVQSIVTMILSMRRKNNIKIRQPLQEAMILIPKNKEIRDYLKKFTKIILKETNIKKITFPNSYEKLELSKNVKPNYKYIGPKFGNNVKKVCELINKLTQDDIKNIEKKHKIYLDGKYLISIKDLKITTKFVKEWEVSFNDNFTIALNLKITNFLKEEGIVREFIRNVQILRKKYKLNVSEKIFLYINTIKELESILKKNKNFICKETLSINIISRKVNNGIIINLLGKKIHLDICIFNTKY